MNRTHMSVATGWVGASLLALAIALPGAAEACTCLFIPFETEYESSELVFSGYSLGSYPSESTTYPDHHYESIQVHAVWKGAVTPVMHILVPNHDGNCGLHFTEGTNVVVFADVYEDGTLYTASCHRSGTYAPGDIIWQQLGPPLSTPTAITSWGNIKAFYR